MSSNSSFRNLGTFLSLVIEKETTSMPGTKIVQILTWYLSFPLLIEISSGFTYFHVSVERYGPLCKFN